MLQAAFRVCIYLSNLALSLKPTFYNAARWDSDPYSLPPPLRKEPTCTYPYEGDLFLLKTLAMNEM